jgi:hypothetical protein
MVTVEKYKLLRFIGRYITKSLKGCMKGEYSEKKYYENFEP